MKGYSKIKIIHSPSNSRSMDLLDLLTSLEKTTTTTTSPSKLQETNHHPPKNVTKATNFKNQESSFLGSQEDRESNSDNNGEMPIKLKRNSSTSTVHSSLKNAFSSLRRSSSVSERYCRIHDQSSTLPSPTHHHLHHDNGDGDAFMNKARSIKKRYRILKACKKLIGM